MTTTLSMYGRLRYTALLNVLVALGPALQVKGRRNDPLLYVDWWPQQYHSAILVVVGTAFIGLGSAYALRRVGVTKWWAYSLCSAAVGAIPGLFYLAAAPTDYFPNDFFTHMVVIGAVYGIPLGAVIAYVLRGGFSKRGA
jgi:hypothetical protein